MLNRPKFMSPSINMYENTVIDLNAETIPFSCIIDGNEAITSWQVQIFRLDDNQLVYDSEEQVLEPVFYPINNRNQNVTFSIDLKKTFAKIKDGEDSYYYLPLVLNKSKSYNASLAYYEINDDDKYVKLTEKPSEFSDNYDKYYVFYAFENSKTGYYWNITFKGTSGTTVKSASEVFYANSVPETSISFGYGDELSYPISTDETNMSTIEKRKVFFKSTYEQGEGVSIKRYGWRLTDTTNDVVVMDTISQNQIYGIQDDITCEFNGLVNQSEYVIELYIETQNGYSDIVQKIPFVVDYVVRNVEADFAIEALRSTPGVLINWGNLRTTEGIVVGKDVQYRDGYPFDEVSSVKIPNDSSILFSETANDKSLNIDENSCVVMSFQMTDMSHSRTLLEMNGTNEHFENITRKLEYRSDEKRLVYTVATGNTALKSDKKLENFKGEICWYVVKLYPPDGENVNFDIAQGVAEGGLFPSEKTYPSDNTYPYLGEWKDLTGGTF